MSYCEITVLATDCGAHVSMASADVTVSRRDVAGTAGGCPVEYMATALGSWIVLTLSAVAEHKGIAPERIEVRVGCTTRNGFSQSTYFHIEIDVGKGLTNREQAILFHSARHCEVGKILRGKIDIEYDMKK